MKFSKSFRNILLGSWIFALFLSGCGGGGSSNSSSLDTSKDTPLTTQQTTPQKTASGEIGFGKYIDEPVEGISYICGEIEGVTNEFGEFNYEVGKECTLKIGDLLLRKIDKSKLNKDEVIIQETKIKISQLLRSLNISQNPDLIKVDNLLAKEFKGEEFQKSIDEVNITKLIQKAQAKLKEKGIKTEEVKIVSQEEAKKHLLESYKKYSKEDNFVLADENTEIFKDQNKDKISLKDSKKEDKTSKKPLKKSSLAAANTLEDSSIQKREETISKKVEDYSYIPKKEELTNRMIVKFLNMTTFGSTPKLVEEVKEKGVIKWLDDQLNMKYDHKKESILRRLIKMALDIDSNKYNKSNKCSMDDWFKENSSCHFNQGLGGGSILLRLNGSAIFNAHLSYEDQVRQRVAYALSQIIVVSQSNDAFFTYHAEALSNYYDILEKDAFGKYGDLLYDISLSPGMGVYLSFINNQKAHEDPNTHTMIYPDENYGREIMQLFSIGLFELNIDGTIKRVNGKRVATYVQDDVMNMSRVFTGLRANNSTFNKPYTKGDLTRPMVCEMEYHDTEPKKVLGQTLPGGNDCYQDIRAAINLLMNHPNAAPFISKKLIMRLTKSNPTTAYVQRVAETFKNSNGDLKKTVRAIYLDPEIWEDIKADRGVKVKEVYIAFTGLLRGIDAKPVPVVSWGRTKINNPGFFSNGLYDKLGQWPTTSPSVFNFYSDDFTPDDSEFKIRGFVAPETEIFTAGYNVKLMNMINEILIYNNVQFRRSDPNEHPERFSSNYVRFYVEYKDILDVFKKNGFGEELDQGSGDKKIKEKVTEKVVDYICMKFLGKKLPPQKRDLLINTYKNAPWAKKGNHDTMYMEARLNEHWIRNIIRDIFFMADYMVQ